MLYGEEILYKYRGRLYLTKPKGTKLQKQQFKDGITYCIMRRDSWFLHILVLLCIIVFSVILFKVEKEIHTASFNGVIYADNEVIHFNIRNVNDNKEKISVSLIYKNEVIINETLLNPNEEVGNMVSTKVARMKEGSYMCTLRYEVLTDLYVKQQDYDVLLVVRK